MACLAFSVLFGLCQQENMLNIALDIIQILVSISEVRECVTQILQNFQISMDAQTRVFIKYITFILYCKISLHESV